MNKRFFISHAALVFSPIFVSFTDIINLIEMTNKRFAVWNDYEKNILIVEAENLPQNAPTSNIFWQEQLI